MPTRTDLDPSPALSILQNGPDCFKGRKLGVLVTDGAKAALVEALKTAVEAAGATVELVTPSVGGIEADDGSWIEGKQKIDGGPSVLYDAVAIVSSPEGAKQIASHPPARDFVSDAFAHLKFIAYTEGAMPLLESAGITKDLDEGCAVLAVTSDAGAFIDMCGKLRHWPREKMLWSI